jgi:hypothetical protein
MENLRRTYMGRLLKAAGKEISSSYKEMRTQQERLRKSYEFLQDAEALIDDSVDKVYLSYGVLRVSTSEARARIWSAWARNKLNADQSTKEIGLASGGVEWRTRGTVNGQVYTVNVIGAELPPNCTIVPKANAYMTYKIVCK